ncbi:hypothetical protein [Tenacibaculum finnmarkense]|uniref:hypothetical protein n=1 Tax=Tenacibaculum finnmarkense TaxID=2781243 RepID=UPI001EFA9FE1|nr:hypothetical protein [Tenacibaculum finnmarkense]MCG8226394.1 hypothetical protein [Tenacibaculum finnmarkense genomovar finnmarkense]
MNLSDLKKEQQFKFKTANSKNIYEFIEFDGVNYHYWGRFYPLKHYKTASNKKVNINL